MFPEVHFQRSYVSVGEVRWRNALRTPQMAHLEVWWLDAHPTPHKASPRMRKHATHRRHKRLTLFSQVRTTKGGHLLHYGTLEGDHRTRTRLGQSPQLNWRLPTTMPQRLQSHKRQQGHKRLQDHKRSTNQHHNRLGFQEPKRNKPKGLNSPNLRGELKPMHQMQEASPSLSNSTKATKSIGVMRE